MANLIETNQYLVEKQKFEILGKIEKPTEGINTDTYIIIDATSLEEAKEVRDDLEAKSYAQKSIDMKDLLTIINNMKRSHGSADISPEMLKILIKQKLTK